MSSAPAAEANKQLPAVSAQPETGTKIVVTRKQPPAEFVELGFNKEQWAVACQQFFPEAKDLNTVVLAAQYCRSKNIDLMAKPIHIVHIAGKDLIWPGINLYRIIAHRTGQYAGKDPARFSDEKIEFIIGGKKELVPEWCETTCYRLVAGQKCSFVERVYFGDVYKPSKNGDGRWEKAWKQMYSKCSEAATLRATFPEEIGSEATFEEMENATADDLGVSESKQVKAKAAEKAKARAEAEAAIEPDDVSIVAGEVEPDELSLQPAIDAAEARAEIAADRGEAERAKQLAAEAEKLKALEEQCDPSKLTILGVRSHWKPVDVRAFAAQALRVQTWEQACEKMTKKEFDQISKVITTMKFDEAMQKLSPAAK